MRTGRASRSPRELTGGTVLCSLVAFFAVVTAVNAVMIGAATSTFGGLETASAYQAGLAFNAERAAATAQDARRWTVGAQLVRQAPDKAELVVTLRDGAGAPLSSVRLEARLAHPADVRRDHRIAMNEAAPGLFKGTSAASSGQWDLLLDVSRGGEHLFRSKSRLLLR